MITAANYLDAILSLPIAGVACVLYFQNRSLEKKISSQHEDIKDLRRKLDNALQDPRNIELRSKFQLLRNHTKREVHRMMRNGTFGRKRK